MRLLERDKGIGFGDGADVPGAVLITTSLMLGVYTIVKPAADYGWGSGRDARASAPSRSRCSSPSSLREATGRNPLIPLRIFRSRNVSGANVIQALTVAGMFGLFFLGSLYLQRVLGYDALADRARVPARDDRHGRAVAPLLGAADHALRRAQDACSRAWRSWPSGSLLFTQAPVDGSYVDERPAADGPARASASASPSRR